MMNQNPFNLSRRQIIRGLLATAAFGATAKLGTGCSQSPETTETTTGSSPSAATSSGSPLIVGFIYVYN